MGVESAFEGERLSLCLKKKTIVKGKCRASGGRALWKGKARVSGYYVLCIIIIIFFADLENCENFKSFGYIYIYI